MYEELCRAKASLTTDDITVEFFPTDEDRDWYWGEKIKLTTREPWLFFFTKKETHNISFSFRRDEEQIFLPYSGFDDLIPFVRDMVQTMIEKVKADEKKERQEHQLADARRIENAQAITERYLNDRTGTTAAR